MNTKLNKVILLLSLTSCSFAQAGETRANDDGGGNSVFLDRHQVDCGRQALRSMQLFRPQIGQIAYRFECLDIGETTATDNYTMANEDGGGLNIYLDRHAVDCQGAAIQYVHLFRPTVTEISYHYTCGANQLLNVQDYYTPANDDGAGLNIYLDRHNISCPNAQVLSYLKLERPTVGTINYHYKCGDANL
jgi:hypothetical protein